MTARLVRRCIFPLTTAVLLFATAALAATPATSGRLVVRCEYTAAGPADIHRNVAFPDSDLFRPSLANIREPRYFFGYRRMQFRAGTGPDGLADTVNVGGASVGGVVGLWARATGACRGVQISVMGAVYADFDLDAPSFDLVNTDFIIGLQVSMRMGPLSGRIRSYHQSSHLGGDFVLHHPSTGDLNFGYQAFDGLVSIDRDWWRVYGGGGYFILMDDKGTSWLAQAGAEFRARRTLGGILRPVAGLDLTRFQTLSLGVTVAAVAGVEWTSPGATRHLRVLAVLSNGFIPLGQLSVDQRSRTAGLQFQIEF